MSDNADFDKLGDMEQCDYCGQWPNEEASRRIVELEQRIHDACESYAGVDGLVPRTGTEGYYLRIIEQMYRALLQEGE